MKKEVVMVQRSNTFDNEKFKQVLHYVISKTSNLENVGKIVLAKIMYFADFDYYELTKNSITGETYIKMPFGPLADHFNEALQELKKEDKIKQINIIYSNKGKEKMKFISTKIPNQHLLNGDEIKQIDMAISKLSGMTAKAASAYSHEDIPWKATKDNQKINYKLVFYRTPLFSVSEEAHA